MKATFYFHTDPLHLNCDLSPRMQTLCKKNVEAILRDISYIIQDKTEENTIVIHPDIFTATINGQLFYEYFGSLLDKEDYNLFLSILNQVDFTDFDIEQIAESTRFREGEKECNVIMEIDSDIRRQYAINPYIEFDRYAVVYNRKRWLYVRRQILGNHPGTAKEFMRRCKSYFPDITFSENCETVINDYLSLIPRKIVYNLSCLNDCFATFACNHPLKNSIKDLVADFSGQYGLDKAASPQSTPDKKEDYTYDYCITKDHPSYADMLKSNKIDPTTGNISFRSSSHFKITQYDNNCAQLNRDGTKKCHGRIYFTFNEYGLFVGSIGPHV